MNIKKLFQDDGSGVSQNGTDKQTWRKDPAITTGSKS
jgi:hypothetical protein